MKIPPNAPGVTIGGATQSGEADRANGPSGRKEITPASGGAVTLSPLATQLHALASGLSGPEFDRAKVDQIKQAITDGTFVVRTDVVADRMIADIKDRLAKDGV